MLYAKSNIEQMKARAILIALFICITFQVVSDVWAQSAPSITVKATWVHPTGGTPADGVRVERSANGSAWVVACTATPPTIGAAVPTTCSDTPQPIRAEDGTFIQYKFRQFRFSTTWGDSAPTPEFVLVTGAPLPVTATWSYTVQP